MFKIKGGYKLESQTPETMKLFGCTKKFIDKGKKRRKSWISWSSLSLKVLYTFTPNKYYAYLLNVEPSNSVFLKTHNTEFDEIIITFTDENGRPLEILS